jgi:hypothetical protein
MRLLASLAITVIIMCDTLSNIFEGVRPFDWLMLAIEVSVVILILYEIIVDTRRRNADAKHKLFVDTQGLALSKILRRGELLQETAPNTLLTTDARVESTWIAEVQAWIRDTDIFVTSKSTNMSADFMLVAPDDTEKVCLWINPSGNGFFVRGQAADQYRKLVVHLDNLRRIISRLEAYL